TPPDSVLEIARTLEEAGFEAWCVGGAVRDALLGHPHLDWDLATSATPAQVRELFGRRRTIPVGIEFGTVGVLDRGGVLHEVTTFRRDVRTDGRHAEVEFGASLDEDLARRDFTINAIAYSPRSRELRDPFDGRADLRAGIVRAVGDPDARMREDRLRALRAIRFATRFGFAIERETLRAIARSAPHLGRLSPERVKQELEKTMDQAARPAAALALWQRTGALATLVPALALLDDRAIATLDCLAMPGPAGRPQRRAIRLAALFLDLTAEDARRALVALRFSRHDSNWIVGMVTRWHRVAARMADRLMQPASVPDVDVRQWTAAIGRLDVGAFMRLALARWQARGRAGEQVPAATRVREIYRRMLHSAFGDPRAHRAPDPLELRDLHVDGDVLRANGMPPGPWTGKILQALQQAVLVDPGRNTPDWLLQEARRMYAELRAADGGGREGGTATSASE
ncbi:MAG TPA: hypothetical protein VJU87_09010, partial [Gemmatimonadaceae bacterium]|nr:hypothetical protein [Gemmatimonadaceae bacterium]